MLFVNGSNFFVKENMICFEYSLTKHGGGGRNSPNIKHLVYFCTVVSTIHIHLIGMSPEALGALESKKSAKQKLLFCKDIQY